MIVDADHISRKRFSGHGSAMAQIYNHIIMPLASTRDRVTQIRWGIADFQSRFGRRPEGMWLPETAVDSESLDLLAQQGIRFVVLAPHQCKRTRAIPDPLAAPKITPAGGDLKDGATPATIWKETPNASVDITRPYLVRLKENRTIAVFFYDGPRSRAIAFEGLLNSGESFARRLLEGFSADDRPQLVHVATDGESYGHHHRYGEMALAWALRLIEEKGYARLTNYGEFLQKFPPTYEAEIVEDTSWSCAHGIERWRSNCGCNGGRAGWNQLWRAPLRGALDWLRDAIAPLVRKKAKNLFADVDRARDGYISVVLDRSHASIDAFLAAYAAQPLVADERIAALELMELERHSMLMYTSCGWFFDDISGIETVQVIAYAGRVLQLAAALFGEEGAALEAEFVRQLAAAKSNVPDEQEGASIYDHYVKKAQVGLEQVAAHYAISSVFTSYADQSELFCYSIRRLAYEVVTSGRGRLVFGRAHICSNITEEQERVLFAVLHFGDQNITAAVCGDSPKQDAEYDDFVLAARSAVIRADFPEVIRTFDRYFAGPTYSIQSLFKDEQQRIVQLILSATLSEVESTLTLIYENQASLLHFLSQAHLPRPAALTMVVTFAINAGLRRALESEPIDAIQVRAFRGLASADQITLDKPLLSYIADQKMKSAMVDLQQEIDSASGRTRALENALLVARTLSELPFELNLWQAQNIWYDAFRLWSKSTAGTAKTPSPWSVKFLDLGRLLRISVDELVIADETPILEAASATAPA